MKKSGKQFLSGELKKSDLPYRAKLAKTWLSHDAKGYSDYLLFRLNDIRQILGIKGFYFDQGGILDSKNVNHNTWIDSDGKKRGSIEILAMRSFLKRLNTILYLSGVEKPRIFIHNSMVPVLPAYTFAYSMVQGEEDIHYLKNYDYTSSYQLEVVRAKYGASITVFDLIGYQNYGIIKLRMILSQLITL